MKHVIKIVNDYLENEDLDEGREKLRESIKTIGELRFAVAITRQQFPDELEELIEDLTDLN